MELCTSRAISNVVNNHNNKPFNQNPIRLRSVPSLLKRTTISQRYPGLFHPATPLLRATTSEETSTVINEQLEEGPDEMITEEKSPSDEQNGPFEAKPVEVVAKEESPMGEQMQAFEFLERFNLKLDSENTYPILIYGSGALVALWLTAAVVGAIDSIPVIPKVLELVGLGFTIWFSSRYLVLKKNREELLNKIEELKEEVIGASDD